MLAYRTATRRTPLSALVAEIAALVDATERVDAGVDEWTELLIAMGEMESAVSDALMPERDDVSELACALTAATRAAAIGAMHAWGARDASTTSTTSTTSTVRDALDDLDHRIDAQLRSRVLQIGVPEGFAYYGLYPETYAASARELLDAYNAPSVVCIGIRSIGTTLGAVAAAVAREAGREVATYTLRPRGHPFDRVMRITPALRDRFADHVAQNALFVVVDEGPGLSGTSFASVAELLTELGAEDDRVVFVPSWVPAPETLRSSRGRERWQRHRAISVSFEDVLAPRIPVEAGRRLLGAAIRADDVGGGAWRRDVYADRRDWPAVQPQHERRKYLLRDGAGEPAALLKFVGLGRYGRAAHAHALALADAGLAPLVFGGHRGYLATEWVEGTRAREGERGRALLEAIAGIVAHRATALRDERTVAFDELLHVARINTAESLGAQIASRLVDALEPFRSRMERVRTCAIDGRMLPHEWIHAQRGWVKADGIDHHDDHFLPGHQDPAWDIAGAIVELLLDSHAAQALVASYRSRSGDHDIAARLPFVRAAYLATRIGYVTLAAQSLHDDPDADRLWILARRYAAMLRRDAVTLGAAEPIELPSRWRGTRAVVFDADDTLRDTTVAGQPCPHAPNEWRLQRWLDGGALTRLPWGERLALGVASNQDHIGYGHISERQSRELLVSMVVEATGYVPERGDVRQCPHVLEVACECRKPGAGMLRAIIERHRIAPDALLFVGNAGTDAEAARGAGARFAHVDDFSAAVLECASRADRASASVASAA